MPNHGRSSFAAVAVLPPHRTLNLPEQPTRYRPKREGAGRPIVRCAEHNSAREYFISPGIPSTSISLSSPCTHTQIDLLARKRVSGLSHPLLQSLQSPLHTPALIRLPSTNSRASSAARDREGARDPQSRLCLLTSPKNPPINHTTTRPAAIEPIHPSPSSRIILIIEIALTDPRHKFGALRPHLSTSRLRGA